MKKVLIIDNYDSFTYNLVQIVEESGLCTFEVVKNDAFDMKAVKQYDKILLSPGPGLPSEAGDLLPLIKQYAATKSILGICLGMQAIAEAFGGQLFQSGTILHGTATPTHIIDKSDYLFKNISSPFMTVRYHSWSVCSKTLPDELTITSDCDGIAMSLRHNEYDVGGVQFHPESIKTEFGAALIENWLRY